MVIDIDRLRRLPAMRGRENNMTAAQQAARHNAIHNEGGHGYNPHNAAIEQEAHAKAEARIQHIIANIGQYRAAWTAAVAKYTKAGQVAAADMPKIEAEAGVTHLEIQAVKSRMAK